MLKRNTTLSNLDLSRNYLTDQQGEDIGNALWCNSSLWEMNLKFHHLGHDGISSINRWWWYSNYTVQVLTLGILPTTLQDRDNARL
jgi:hypothetical protein